MGRLSIFSILLCLILGSAQAQPSGPSELQTKHRVVWVSVFPLAQVGAYTDAFREGLRLEGIVEGRDVEFVGLSAEGLAARLPEIVERAVSLRPAVIVAQGAAVFGFKNVRNIPVVFGFSGDPIAAGFTDSFARPSRNLTGVSFMAAELNEKRLDLLRVASPAVKNVVLIGDPIHPGVDQEIAASMAAAQRLGLNLTWKPTRNVGEVREVLAGFQKAKPDALVVLPDAVMLQGRKEITEFALQHSIPTVSGWSIFAESGGLFTYGPKLSESFKRVAYYTARIIRGAKPTDLPIERPTQFELVLNAKTSTVIGITLPQQFFALADEVIE